MLGNRVPICLSDGVEEITATRNQDWTYRITANIKVKHTDGEETCAMIEVERAFLHIEALYNGGELYRLVVPDEDPVSVYFPEPSQEDWELLGIDSPKEEDR